MKCSRCQHEPHLAGQCDGEDSMDVTMNCPCSQDVIDDLRLQVKMLRELLAESRRKHMTACHAYSNYQPPYEDCTCGADAWSARVDAVLGQTS